MLTRKILAINITPLALFVAGIFYLDNQREELVTAKLDLMLTQSQVITASFTSSSFWRVCEQPTGTNAGSGFITIPISTDLKGHCIDVARARVVVGQFVTDPDLRARYFDATMSESGHGVGDEVMIHERPDWSDPGQDAAMSWYKRLDQMLMGLRPIFSRYEPMTKAHYSGGPELAEALESGMAYRIRDAGDAGLFMTLAMPVPTGIGGTIGGVLLLESQCLDVATSLNGSRNDILYLALITLLITVVLSFYLSRTIVSPIQKLATATNKVRTGSGNASTIPDLASRRDEIADLGKGLSDMTFTLERRLQASKEFAEYIGHQMKTPVGALRNLLYVVSTTSDPADRERLIANANSNVDDIARLLNEVAEASSLEARLSVMTAQPIDVGLMLRARAINWNERWGADTPALKFGPGLSGDDVSGRYVVAGSVEHLDQTISNLLDNARSFSPHDSTITLDCSEADLEIVITVADEGPGIPAHNRDLIFERFFSDRIGADDHDRHSGLGLTICRQIVVAHGGTIEAFDRANIPGDRRGTQFEIRLPVRPATRAE